MLSKLDFAADNSQQASSGGGNRRADYAERITSVKKAMLVLTERIKDPLNKMGTWSQSNSCSLIPEEAHRSAALELKIHK